MPVPIGVLIVAPTPQKCRSPEASGMKTHADPRISAADA